jgi:hypothetical protein
MQRLRSLIASIFAVGVALCTPAQRAAAQDVFVTGEAGIAWLGFPVIGASYGVPAFTTRFGVGSAYDRFEVEFDVGAVTGLDEFFSNGMLLVPSVDMRYLFREPDRSVRPYVGGGADVVVAITDGMVFGLPWAHLTLGLDTKISDDASIYVEARNYALESQLSVGTKLSF